VVRALRAVEEVDCAFVFCGGGGWGRGMDAWVGDLCGVAEGADADAQPV